MLKKIFVTVAILNFVALNAAVGFLVFKEVTVKDEVSETTSVINQQESDTVAQTQNAGFVCDENCQKIIEEKVTALIPTTSSVQTKTIPIPTIKPTKTRFFSYIPIPGAGNTTNTTWTNLAGTEFAFSKGDYVGFKEAYFEANIKLFNGNGVGYVRLFDVTNGRAVDGSEVSTSSQTSVAVSSGKISLWEGNNTYRVQVRSLTADTTYYDSGRIKIINEQ